MNENESSRRWVSNPRAPNSSRIPSLLQRSATRWQAATKPTVDPEKETDGEQRERTIRERQNYACTLRTGKRCKDGAREWEGKYQQKTSTCFYKMAIMLWLVVIVSPLLAVAMRGQLYRGLFVLPCIVSLVFCW